MDGPQGDETTTGINGLTPLDLGVAPAAAAAAPPSQETPKSTGKKKHRKNKQQRRNSASAPDNATDGGGAHAPEELEEADTGANGHHAPPEAAVVPTLRTPTPPQPTTTTTSVTTYGDAPGFERTDMGPVPHASAPAPAPAPTEPLFELPSPLRSPVGSTYPINGEPPSFDDIFGSPPRAPAAAAATAPAVSASAPPSFDDVFGSFHPDPSVSLNAASIGSPSSIFRIDEDVPAPAASPSLTLAQTDPAPTEPMTPQSVDHGAEKPEPTVSPAPETSCASTPSVGASDRRSTVPTATIDKENHEVNVNAESSPNTHKPAGRVKHGAGPAHRAASASPTTTKPSSVEKASGKAPATKSATKASAAATPGTRATTAAPRANGTSVGTKKTTKTPPKESAPSPPTRDAVSPPPAPSGGDSDLRPKKKISTAEAEAAGNRLYERAMESKRRLEAKKAESEELKHTAAVSTQQAEAAGNRLYERAMESKRRLEARKAEIEEAKKAAAPPVQPKSKRMDTTEASNRFVQLHEKAKEAQRKREELRERLEKEKCTFKPEITSKAKRISGKTDKPRYENLYKHAQEIQAKREEKKQELEKQAEEFSFRPKIKTTKSPVRSRPLYDADRLKQKRMELEQKKIEAELNECTFKPKVVTKSKSSVPATDDDKIFNRLYQAGQQRSERLAKLKQEKEDQERNQLTFKPKVSGAAEKVASTKPFHQRLYDKDYLRKVAEEREQRKLEEEKQRFSFKPQISDVPEEIKSKDSNGKPSSGKSSIFERLYQDKDRLKEKIELSEELRIQKEMEECTFRPQIDAPTSATKNDDSTPIWERLLSIDKNQIIEERERIRQQLEIQECTFKPEIAQPPGSLSPRRVSSVNIFERLSVSAGNTPVDDKKRRQSERKPASVQGKRLSYAERSSVTSHGNDQRRVISVGEIIKSSSLIVGKSVPGGLEFQSHSSRSLPSSLRSYDLKTKAGALRRSSSTTGPQHGDDHDDVKIGAAFNPENGDNGLTEAATNGSFSSGPGSILENYDSWAAQLEEKMRNL